MKVHIDTDSWKHYGVNAACAVIGALIGLILGVWVGNIPVGYMVGLAFGIGVGAGASITREYDGKQFHGHWCWMDILFDFLGLLTGTGLMVLIGWLIWR